LELTDGIKNFVMASRRVSIEARVGERMGDMYGIGFTRVQNTDKNKPYYDPTGNNVGQMVFANGARYQQLRELSWAIITRIGWQASAILSATKACN
jgi:hypothetical protein